LNTLLDDGSERRMNFIRRFPRSTGSPPVPRPDLVSPARVALVGLGYWGPNLLRVLAELPDVKVRYACDLDPTRLGKAIRRYPAVEPTTDLERVLDDPEVDAVIIAASTSTSRSRWRRRSPTPRS
jgi:FlaA1/EpsC-like NDP-sugar epimerase